jgi:hypothetical protein
MIQINQIKNVFFLVLFYSGSILAQKQLNIVEVTNDQKVSKGSLNCYQFPFKDSSNRKVLIWLPSNYNPKVKYATIYMHDGQMLFDATTTWNKKEWRVDETADSLISNGITRPFIVVGIYNDPPNRYAEFFPQQTAEYMDTAYVNKLKKTLWNGELRADYYLEWMTKELIPFVESTYNVSHKSADRFLIGSSMGGLISLYGLTQKPKTFGGAACLSIHTPMINFQMTGDDAMNQLVLPFNAYLSKKLPSPNKVKIYIDRGTETLDANYGPYHEVLINTLQSCGYQTGPNFLPLVWDKTGHDEVPWANRLAVPIKFLLIKDK